MGFNIQQITMLQTKYQQEQDILKLIKDLQQSKETQVRADLEKEQIARSIRNQSKEELNSLGEDKRKELEKLRNQRNKVLTQEENLKLEVANLEKKLYEQERSFKEMEKNAGKETKDIKDATLKALRSKEMEYVAQQASAVAKIKVERERLEIEREKIMNQLEKRTGSRQDGFRLNPSAQKAGVSVLGGINLKDKVAQDEARLLMLKERQLKEKDEFLDGINDLDVMYNDLDKKPKFHQNLQKLANQYEGGDDIVRQVGNFNAINSRLEKEAYNSVPGPTNINAYPIKPMHSPSPSPSPSKHQTLHPKAAPNPDLDNALDDLEHLLLGNGKKPQAQAGTTNRQDFNQSNFMQSPSKIAPKPTAPASNALSGHLNTFDPFSINHHNQSSFAPPNVGFNSQTSSVPSVDPYQFAFAGAPGMIDPAMVQLASMLHSQDNENKKLKNILEEFGKNESTQEQFDQALNAQNRKINNLRAGFRGLEDSKENIIGPPKIKKTLPDDFNFRQNEGRTDDLEVEERALMNLAAQEIDQMRIIQKLPKGSEVYNLKLKQFKELSAMRLEVEKVLQEQRLEKVQRDYARQKVDEERNGQHQDWMDAQKMTVLQGRLAGDMQASQANMSPLRGPSQMMNQSPMMMQPVGQQSQPRKQNDPNAPLFKNVPIPTPISSVQTQNARTPQQKSEKSSFIQDIESTVSPKEEGGSDYNKGLDKYHEDVGMVLTLDLVSGLPRQVRSVKVVYSAFKGPISIGEPGLAGPVFAEQDKVFRELNKVLLCSKQLMTRIPESQESKIVFELQAVDPTQPSGFTSVGWTWFNLFSLDYDLQNGKWQLPVYSGPTKPDQTTGSIDLEQAAGVSLNIKVGLPGDTDMLEKINHLTEASDYNIPKYHLRGRQRFDKSSKQPTLSKQVTNRQPNILQPDFGDNSRSPAQSRLDAPPVQKTPPRQQDEEKPARHIKRDPRYRCKGIRVRFHYSQLSKQYEKLTLRASLFQGTSGVAKQDNGKDCLSQAPQLDEKAFIKAKATTSVVMDSTGKIVKVVKGTEDGEPLSAPRVVRLLDEFEFVWERDFYQLFIDKKGQERLIMVVEVFGSLPGQERKAIGFANLEINNQEDGKILHGFHALQLFQAPISFLEDEQVELPEEMLGLSLLDPLTTKITYRDEKAQEKANARPQSPISEQFVANYEKQYTMSESLNYDTEQLDIYIDAARYLPDNVSITKLVVRIVDNKNKDLTQKLEAMADIQTSNVRNQNFNLKIPLQLKKASPSAFVYIQIETFSQSSKLARIVGTSYFPLFIDTKTEMPAVLDSAAKHICPHLGEYQMPIYHSRVNEASPFTYERFIYKERVPSASVLIRVRKEPRKAPGEQSRTVIAPTYKEGVYSTKYYIITDEEKEVMNLRRHKPSPSIMNVVVNLLSSQGITELTSIDPVETLFKMIKTDKKSGLIDLTYHSQYEPKIGVRFNIETIHDNKAKGFLVVMASVLPEASYYDQQRTEPPSDAFVFSNPDFDSCFNSAKFQEGDELIIGFESDQPGLSILLDIKMYNPDRDAFEDYGFTICPMLQDLNTDADDNSLELYVNSGIFSLPIYKGRISDSILEMLLQASQPLFVMQQLLQNKNVQLLGSTSIVAKIVDQQRKLHFRSTIDETPPSLKFLDPSLHKSHKYSKTSGKLLKELVPKAYKKESDFAGFAKYLKSRFREHMGLPQ